MADPEEPIFSCVPRISKPSEDKEVFYLDSSEDLFDFKEDYDWDEDSEDYVWEFMTASKTKTTMILRSGLAKVGDGLQFPVGRIGRYLSQDRYITRMGASAPVYLAAVLEYLCAEILELAGNAARDSKGGRYGIAPRHITMAVRNDEELNKLLGGVTIAAASFQTREEKEAPKRDQSYSTYIYEVLKQVHPDIGISRNGMSIMNSFINDIFERIASQAGKLVRYNKKRTLTSREIQTAVRLILPGQLAKHAVTEGTKAVKDMQDQKQHSMGIGGSNEDSEFLYEPEEDDEEEQKKLKQE